MLTISALRAFGANVEEGLARCMDNEDFYLRMVGKAVESEDFESLQNALNRHDIKAAFEHAHALKGITGNLSLNPIYHPVAELTEHLRAGEDGDYSHYMNEIFAQRDALRALA